MAVVTPTTALVLCLLGTLTPEWHHRWTGEKPDVTHARYVATAETIARVAEESEPLEGLTRTQTGLLLAGVLARESHLRPDVMTCRKFGMGGARGPYQTEQRKHFGEACASLESATRLALRMLSESWHVCDGMPMAERAAFYVGGMGWKTKQARWESRRRVTPALLWRLGDR